MVCINMCGKIKKWRGDGFVVSYLREMIKITSIELHQSSEILLIIGGYS